MKKLFTFFAAALVALAVNAQTDFSTPYYCAAADAVLSGSSAAAEPSVSPVSSSMSLVTAETPYIAWLDVSYGNAVATWTVTATKGCYVSVSLDLGSAGNNKHIFQVKILEGSIERGTVAEGPSDASGSTDGYPQDINKVKALDGTILLPNAGEYTIELRNERGFGKGAVKNVILTYAADAPTEIIEVSSVELNKSEVTLDLQEVELLTATVSPDNATDPTVTWSSSDEAVATVNANGLVTAVATGTANITATAGEQSAICEVTVSAAPIPDVNFSEPCVLAGKVAHLEGAIWKNKDYKLYGDGGHNKKYGNASWTINVTKPCIVSGMLNGMEGGHDYKLDLFFGEDSITTVNQSSATWSSGDKDLDGNLTFNKAGVYTLRLRNTQEWSSGKVAGITLTYVSDLPITLYLKAGVWNDAGAKFGVYVREEGWWPEFMTQVGETDIYTIQIPANKRYLNFVRFANTKEAPGEGDIWNQVVNLNRENDNNCLKITGWGNDGYSTGEWRKYFPDLEEGYYLAGTFNSWEPAAADKFASLNESEYTIEADLVDGDRFKAISLDADKLLTGWYPSSGDGYEVTEWTEGEKTIYFRPTYHDAWSGHFYIAPNEPTVTYSDFEIDLRDGQLGTEGSNLQKYLTVGEPYVYSDEMPIAYNAILNAARFNNAQDPSHGYVNFVATIPVEAGNYKITVGNCSYNSTNGAVKNADGTETLDLIDMNGQTITAIETPKNCYHQNTTENVTSVWFVAEDAQTIQIVCPQYAPYIKVEQVAEVPEEVIVYNVTFAHAEGATGVLPANLENIAPTTAITLPKNFSMYKEGYTFVGWTDGEDVYDPGFGYEVTDDVTFTAVYAENTVSLAGRTEAVTIKWEFSQSKGVAPINVSGTTTFVVAQATIGESKIDVKLPIDATAGKFVNSANSWTQINPGVIFSIPSAKDAVITYKQYDAGAVTTPEINVSATDATYQLVAAGTSGQLYYEYVQVVLPKPMATSISNTEISSKAQKLIENGQIVIIKNGVKYNVLGACLK